METGNIIMCSLFGAVFLISIGYLVYKIIEINCDNCGYCCDYSKISNILLRNRVHSETSTTSTSSTVPVHLLNDDIYTGV
jgi:hypothetical protein